MDFGPDVRPAPDASAAAWIPALGRFNVGGLVPSGFDRCLFVDDVDPEADPWWAAEWAHTAAIAQVAGAHTATPDRAFFAIWEGHGYPEAGLERIPRFSDLHQDRTYYLIEGAVAEVVDILEPGRHRPDQWRQPDLWWPADQAWIVCTDVDLACNYVAGTPALIEAVAAAVSTETHLVDRTDDLEQVC